MFYNAVEMVFIGTMFAWCAIMGTLGLVVYLDERGD